MAGGSEAVVALLSLVFAVLSVMLGLVVRGAMRWARVEDRIDHLAADFTEIVGQMRDDRQATNERLTYLERSVWPRNRGGRETKA
jgi:hypothetical protein